MHVECASELTFKLAHRSRISSRRISLHSRFDRANVTRILSCIFDDLRLEKVSTKSSPHACSDIRRKLALRIKFFQSLLCPHRIIYSRNNICSGPRCLRFETERERERERGRGREKERNRRNTSWVR